MDVDLEKFFDRVSRGILIDRLHKRIADAGAIRLIHKYLNSGNMQGGVLTQRQQRMPHGEPLLPYLASVFNRKFLGY